MCYDLLGLTPTLRPKFVKRYAEFFADGVAAAKAFCEEVRNGSFPAEEHGFGLVRADKTATRHDTNGQTDSNPLDLNRLGYGPQA